MDEPTAALARDQAARRFDVARSFRERGVCVIYISHFLREVLDLADVVTVMRDGAIVSTRPDDAPVVARAEHILRPPATPPSPSTPNQLRTIERRLGAPRPPPKWGARCLAGCRSVLPGRLHPGAHTSQPRLLLAPWFAHLEVGYEEGDPLLRVKR